MRRSARSRPTAAGSRGHSLRHRGRRFRSSLRYVNCSLRRRTARHRRREAGEEVIITGHGRAVAHIHPVSRPKHPLMLDDLAAFRATMPGLRRRGPMPGSRPCWTSPSPSFCRMQTIAIWPSGISVGSKPDYQTGDALHLAVANNHRAAVIYRLDKTLRKAGRFWTCRSAREHGPSKGLVYCATSDRLKKRLRVRSGFPPSEEHRDAASLGLRCICFAAFRSGSREPGDGLHFLGLPLAGERRRVLSTSP
jgi:antitoxin (DNA-binding transcriptional repressor) of toxin-antitoxin stability system